MHLKGSESLNPYCSQRKNTKKLTPPAAIVIAARPHYIFTWLFLRMWEPPPPHVPPNMTVITYVHPSILVITRDTFTMPPALRNPLGDVAYVP